MRFITAFVYLVLLICPCALCYGQVSFSSVNGERGYAAMRGSFVLHTDNGITLIPSGGYYRITDSEEDETGAGGKIALEGQYEIGNPFLLRVGGAYIPRRLGFEAAEYYIGGQYSLCYRCGPFKNVYLGLNVGQTLYDLTAYSDGSSYGGHFHTAAGRAGVDVGSEVGKFFVQVRYDKVIKYTHRPPENIVSNWTEIPFMTAIVQGFIRDVSAIKLSYRTRWITPYAVYARYKYTTRSKDTISVAGGASLHWGATSFSGGVEIFEQNREENRKTYFSMAINTEF